MGPSTLSSWALLIARTLQARGIDAEALFRRAGLNPEHLGDPDVRYPIHGVQKLWALGVEATKDSCFGLEVGKFWHPTTFHAIGYTAIAAKTVRETLTYLARYMRVVTTGLSLELADLDEQVVVNFALLLRTTSSIWAHAAVTSIVILCRDARGAEINPVGVSLVQADGMCLKRMEEFFRCPVSIGASHTSLKFRRADLDAPLSTANQTLVRANEAVLSEYLSRLGVSDFVFRVRTKLIHLLPTGEINAEAVARSLNVSLRSLQRQLREEGITFRQLIDSTRRDLAEHYLKDSTLSVAEVAYLLGFGETSSFTRAFRRWTGHTPRHK